MTKNKCTVLIDDLENHDPVGKIIFKYYADMIAMHGGIFGSTASADRGDGLRGVKNDKVDSPFNEGDSVIVNYRLDMLPDVNRTGEFTDKLGYTGKIALAGTSNSWLDFSDGKRLKFPNNILRKATWCR